MSRHCPFPVRCSDHRRCYRVGSAPGFLMGLLLVAGLAGYVGLSDAAPIPTQGRHFPAATVGVAVDAQAVAVRCVGNSAIVVARG